MKHKLIAAVLLTLLPVFSTTGAESDFSGMEVRLMNINNILRACKMHQFSNSSAIVADVDIGDNTGIASAEGEDSIIDTQEEFITAAYYNIKILPANAQKVISAELPKGKTGALRVAAMWMKKRAEEFDSGYIKAIEIIKEKSGITESEINTFFAAAIEKEVMKQGKVYLGKYYSGEKLKDAVRPLVEYYINPTKENLEKLDDAHSSVKSPSAYIDLIREVGGLGGNSLTTKVILYSH